MDPRMQAYLIGAVIGLLVGLVPLIVGIRRRQSMPAVAAFLLCGGAGFFSPLFLSLPIALLSAWGIRKLSPDAEATGSVGTTE